MSRDARIEHIGRVDDDRKLLNGASEQPSFEWSSSSLSFSSKTTKKTMMTIKSRRRSLVSSSQSLSRLLVNRFKTDNHLLLVFLISFLLSILLPREGRFVAASYNYYNYHNGNNYNYDDAQNNDNDANNNDNDDGKYDDGYAYQNNGDDGDDYYKADDGNYNANARDDDYYINNKSNSKYQDDDNNKNYQKEMMQYQDKDDDMFHWDKNVGFDGVSVMPVSCVNYNNGHMIKFQLFNAEEGYQCHFGEIATFVVSIAHYMRGYFNYQAMTQGTDFQLPSDAALLNCIQLKDGSASSDANLYVKIGCMERETFTSTKLQLHVYTDAQCSQAYEDGGTPRQHATRGYKIGNSYLKSKVSFRPPFYSCLTCAPEEIAASFNKQSNNWYDDDFISKNRYAQNQAKKNQNNNQGDDDGTNDGDDDGYKAANDDVQDDAYGNRELSVISFAQNDLTAYHDQFWKEYADLKNRLLNNYYQYDYNQNDWNMCQRIYKYGVWCDEECRALDFFRTDQWSTSDVFLLGIMCAFMCAMMLLIVAKRLKAQQKARVYGEDQPMPGLPPFAMAIIFCLILTVISVLAELKFINETLVFAVVTCILLFIYMLKLTLFENRRPVLLAAPRHDMFDNPLDEHLFD